jgi:hypothetical protein
MNYAPRERIPVEDEDLQRRLLNQRYQETARPAVQARPLPSTRKPTAIISSAALERLQGPMERIFGALVLLLSAYAACVTFNGGELWPIAPNAIIYGLSVQIAVTIVQWVWHPRRQGYTLWQAVVRGRLKKRFAAATLIGIGTTVAGFAPHIAPALASWLVRWIDAPYHTVIGWGILILAASVIEWYPEDTLVG